MAAGKPDPDGNRDDKIGKWTVDSWGGINLHDPPHLIGNNEFQHLENTRWKGSRLIPRKGQTKYKTTTPAGADYTLWGAYGSVMAHGGVGGVGFKDVPTGDIMGAFP